MNFRVWGSFIVIAACLLAAAAMMGCDRGGLGVRVSNVFGTIVDSTSSAPIPGVRVRMVSETAVSANTQQTLGQNYVTLTDAKGNFIFTNVVPDKMKLEASKVGYEDLEYPSASSTVTVIYIGNGEELNLGELKMTAIGNPVQDYITVRLTLRDSQSMEILPDDKLVTISFDNASFTKTVEEWQKKGISIRGKTGEYGVSIYPEDVDLYKTKSLNLAGNQDILTDILLDPYTYNILVRCVNVPSYITGGIINIYAEKLNTKPPKVLATQTIDNLGNLSEPNLPAVVTVPGIAFPIDLRINVRGYNDEVMTIHPSIIKQGEQGNIRLDVDFLDDNHATEFALDPSINTAIPPVASYSKAALLDNQLTRNVTIRVAGPDLTAADTVVGNIWHYDTFTTYNPPDPCDLNFDYNMRIPVGYELPWAVAIYPDPTGPAAASGSYAVSGSTMIDPLDSADEDVYLLISAEAKRP